MSNQDQSDQTVSVTVSVDGMSQEELQQLADDINEEFPEANATVQPDPQAQQS